MQDDLLSQSFKSFEEKIVEPSEDCRQNKITSESNSKQNSQSNSRQLERKSSSKEISFIQESRKQIEEKKIENPFGIFNGYKLGKEPPKKISKFPKVYLINNLLKLSKELKFFQLERYILLQSYKTGVSYSCILLCFGIEKLVSLFYKDHALSIQINPQYAFREIEQNLIKFLGYYSIKDRLLLSKVVHGACCRLGAGKFFSERWLTKRLINKRSTLESLDVRVSKLLASDNRFILQDTDDYPYTPATKDLYKSHFDHKEKYPILQLESEGEEELANPEVYHTKRQIYYWKNYKPEPQVKRKQSEVSYYEGSESQEKSTSKKKIAESPISKKPSPNTVARKHARMCTTGMVNPTTVIPIREQPQQILQDEDSEEIKGELQKIIQKIPQIQLKREKMIKKWEEKKQMRLLKEDQQDKKSEKSGKSNEEIEESNEDNFKIKITPQKTWSIITKIQKQKMKMISALQTKIKMKAENVEFIYNNKQKYMNILKSKEKQRYLENLIEWEENESVLDEKTIQAFLKVKMKNFVLRTMEEDIEVICNQCRNVLEKLKVPKEKHEAMIKNWMEKMRKRK